MHQFLICEWNPLTYGQGKNYLACPIVGIIKMHRVHWWDLGWDLETLKGPWTFNGQKKIYTMNNIVILDHIGLFIYIDGRYFDFYQLMSTSFSIQTFIKIGIIISFMMSFCWRILSICVNPPIPHSTYILKHACILLYAHTNFLCRRRMDLTYEVIGDHLFNLANHGWVGNH